MQFFEVEHPRGNVRSKLIAITVELDDVDVLTSRKCLQLLLKTTTPFVLVAMLWFYPLVLRVGGKEHTLAMHRAARYSLLLMELICPSTTSTIMRTFVCSSFDDGAFLRAGLSDWKERLSRSAMLMEH